MLGVAIATYVYMINTDMADRLKKRFSITWTVLDRKYGFDELWQNILAAGGIGIASGLSRGGGRTGIAGWPVNGSARFIGRMAAALSTSQFGYLLQYAFVMVV